MVRGVEVDAAVAEHARRALETGVHRTAHDKAPALKRVGRQLGIRTQLVSLFVSLLLRRKTAFDTTKTLFVSLLLLQ